MDLIIGIVALIVITLANSDVVEYGVLKSSNTPEFPRCVKPNISAPMPSIIEQSHSSFSVQQIAPIRVLQHRDAIPSNMRKGCGSM